MTKLGSHVSKHHQRGFSLVEIMVALLLGAVITVGIVQMFTSNRTTYQINMGQARLQENARFAMEFVTSSMRMAGYRGCSNRTPITDGLAGDADLLAQFDIDDSIFGHTAVGGGDWEPELDSLPDDIDIDEIAAGRDVLVLRTALDDGVSFTGVPTGNPAQSFVDLPAGCTGQDCDGYAAGTVVIASDCLNTAVFMLTDSEGQPGQNRMLLEHGTGTTIDGISNGTNPIDTLGSPFGADASLFRVGTEYYFIAPGLGTNTPMSLWRKRGQEAPVELVEGVDGLTLLYGEDTDGDRVPNRYRPFNDVSNSQDIVTIRVTVSATSVDAVADGDMLRRDFTKTVAIRNRI